MSNQNSTENQTTRAQILAQANIFQKLGKHENQFFAQTKTDHDTTHLQLFDLEKNTFHCSCPIRRRPCHHLAALQFFLEKNGADIFQIHENLPDWAENLKNGAAAAANFSKKRTAEEREADKQKRLATRIEKAAAGFDDLENWLRDTIQNGLADSFSDDPDFLENIASRLADASMSGVSRELRLLAAAKSDSKISQNWHARAAETLAELHLLVRTFRRRDRLPDALIFDLQTKIGMATRKEEVFAAGEKINDHWAVLSSKIASLEGALFERKTWLVGSRDSRFALILEFQYGSKDFPAAFQTGEIVQGTLHFFPSAVPTRALAADDLKVLDRKITRLAGGFSDFKNFTQDFAERLGKLPWLAGAGETLGSPAIFAAATPYYNEGKFFLADSDGHSLPLEIEEIFGWQLLSFSGGQAIAVFGEWKNLRLLALLAVADGRFLAF